MNFKLIVGSFAFLLLPFLGFVSSRNGAFHYERSGLINAPADRIFPYLRSFVLCREWSPFEKKEMELKYRMSGTDGEVGAVEEFEGNRDAGAGKLELLRVEPNSLAQFRLTMTKPFGAENLIEYRLTPEGTGTRFTWVMSGDSGFIGKLMTLVIDCEKMMAGRFDEGIANLKQVVEAKK